MSYLGIDPSLRAYKQALFRATGGETTLPIDIDVEALVIKNGSLLIPDNDYYINDSNRIIVSKPALPGDEYFVINLSTFSFDGMATKKDLQDAMASVGRQPLFFVMWWPKRSTIPAGFVPADGQELSRTLYADAFTEIEKGVVPTTADADWLSTPTKRASYTTGDGSTTFRVPDYNGKSQGGSAAVVLRGDGLNTDPTGSIQGDAIRNITGAAIPKKTGGQWTLVGDYKGALKSSSSSPVSVLSPTGESVQSTGGIVLDASLVVPTGPENRMVNTAGVWCIRLFNGTVYDSLANAAQLATEVGKLNSEVQQITSELELGRWYTSASQQFKDRIRGIGSWITPVNEISMKETKYEIRIKGIVRVAPGMSASKEILRISNPSNTLLVKDHESVLISLGDTQGGFLSTYLERISTKNSEAFLSIGGGMESLITGWCMIDVVILKDPVSTGGSL